MKPGPATRARVDAKSLLWILTAIFYGFII